MIWLILGVIYLEITNDKKKLEIHLLFAFLIVLWHEAYNLTKQNFWIFMKIYWNKKFNFQIILLILIHWNLILFLITNNLQNNAKKFIKIFL